MGLINIKKFKEQYSDLYNQWSKMTKEELLLQIAKEAVDAINMEARVAVFMQHCTQNYSNTNYTPDVLIMLINNKKEHDLKSWCEMVIEDANNEDDYSKYIVDQVTEQVGKEL